MTPTPPAEGERRAITGYYHQYRIASTLVVRALHRGELAWIRIADPKAGRVDDFQIASKTRLDAYQVKWSQHPGSITFSNIVTASADAPPLIAQLADGWKTLKQQHPRLRVVVHLITNEIASTALNAVLPVGDPPPGPRHFAAFIAQEWNPARSSTSMSIWTPTASWLPTWDALIVASGLIKDDFMTFVQDCEFDLGYQLVGPSAASTRDGMQFQEDVEQLAYFIFGLVADAQRIVEVDRDQLLARLDWSTRSSFRNQHDFPVDAIQYEPVQATIEHLQGAITSLGGGYIAVLGTPGSGKSTLLTQTLRYRAERIIRYYAYVPDAQQPIALRGEATSFLHDTVLALQREGFGVGESLNSLDYESLLERFHAQLQLAHVDWLDKGRKTIFLIDGLDHIAREQHPTRSLLSTLPFPEQIPDGIYLILGSQTDQLADLPDRVQFSIRQPERRIEMEPLSREAVHRLFAKANLPVALQVEHKDLIFRLTEGHPLACGYLLQRLSGIIRLAELDNVLATSERYTGGIEEQYYSYWRSIGRDDFELQRLLGLLARMRNNIDLDWVATWISAAAIDKFRTTAYYFFRHEEHPHWHFYHNSFRLFLIEETSKDPTGTFSPERDAGFHRELGDRCSTADADSYWSWEELFHRVSANQHELVVQKASTEWFRSQFRAFRPVQAIEIDIKMLLQSAARLQDPVILTRALLLGAEFADRASHLQDADLSSLLLDIDRPQVAIEHVRDGNQLRIEPKLALSFSLQILKTKYREEARRIFDLAEPIEILSGMKAVEDYERDTIELLHAWSQVAVYFREITTVIAATRKITQEIRFGAKRDSAVEARHLQNELLITIGAELASRGNWIDLGVVLQALNNAERDDAIACFWLLFSAWREALHQGNRLQAELLFQQAREISDRIETNQSGRIVLAEGAFRVLGDASQARELLNSVSQPPIRADIISIDTDLEPFLFRFRLNRLLFALGENNDPVALVPDANNPREQGFVVFERAICMISKIWGSAWAGVPINDATFSDEVMRLVRFYYLPKRTGRDWTGWYVIERLQSDYFRLLIDAVAQHGFEAVENLRNILSAEWQNPELSAYWQIKTKRTAILALAKLGAPHPWVMNTLTALGTEKPDDRDVRGRIEALRDQARAWSFVDEKVASRSSIDDILAFSFGIGHEEDYQLNTWIDWLDKTIQLEPMGAGRLITWMAGVLPPIKESAGRGITRSAAADLISVAFRWCPHLGIRLKQWCIEQGVIEFDCASSNQMGHLRG